MPAKEAIEIPGSVRETVTGNERGTALLGGDSESHDLSATVVSRPQRVSGLDFVKGILVLVMVLYHWMNYYVGVDDSAYKFLRFLTPSFIFLTGFLISFVYLPRIQAGKPGVSVRLLGRGFKLLAIVLVLNGGAILLGSSIGASRVAGRPLFDLVRDLLVGTTPVSFSILVPIAYLLLLAAGLLPLEKRLHGILHLISATFICACLALDWNGAGNGYLEMLSMGMLGVSAGFVPITRVGSLTSRWIMLLLAYGAYLVALLVWNTTFAIQIVGVCLNLAIFFGLAGASGTDNPVGRALVLVGEYSLFAYIAQIVLLQIFRKLGAFSGLGTGISIFVLFFAGAATVLSVMAVDRARHRFPLASKIYAGVFA